MCLVGLVSCNASSKLINLEDAYNTGIISKEELWNIAYYHNECINASDVEYDLKDIGTLPNYIERKIKNYYKKIELDDVLCPSNKLIYISGFYGEYNNKYVVKIHNEYKVVDLYIYDEYRIDEIVFLKYSVYGFYVYVD